MTNMFVSHIIQLTNPIDFLLPELFSKEFMHFYSSLGRHIKWRFRVSRIAFRLFKKLNFAKFSLSPNHGGQHFSDTFYFALILTASNKNSYFNPWKRCYSCYFQCSKGCDICILQFLNLMICIMTCIFYLLFGYSNASLGPLTRRQPHSVNVNHSANSSLTWSSPWAS